MDYLIIFLTEKGALPTKAYRDDGDETLAPGSAPYREDGVRSIQG